MSEKRQLAAIMFTDIVGYTALMGKDEHAAYQLLKRNRGVQKPLIQKYGGKWLKEMGDGVLASFDTVTDAVNCAIQIQSVCKKADGLTLRIGIHLGEVIVDKGDVFGDGVNIASRLEQLAPAGGIFISESVYNNIKNRKDIHAEFVREENLKNVDHPVRIFQVNVDASDRSEPYDKEQKVSVVEKKSKSYRKVIAGFLIAAIVIIAGFLMYKNIYNNPATVQISIPDKKEKSIAVLPFKNFTGDPSLEYMCDGMTDAVISRLTKVSGIEKVISMTSVLAYKNSQKTIPEIADELKVNFILEANFQLSADMVKVTLQLIDGETDNHYWAEEYMGLWSEDIFKIQADVAENVASNLGAQLSENEIESIQKIPTINKDAYNLYLQAEYQRNKNTETSYNNAIPLYETAIEMDPNFVEAYLGLATVWTYGGIVWGIFSEQEAWNNARELLEKALEIDSNNGEVLTQLYNGYFYYDWDLKKTERFYHEGNIISDDYLIKTGRFEEALNLVEQSIMADPSDGVYYSFKAECLMFLGKMEKAIELLAMTDPLYQDNWWYLREASKIYYYLGEYEKSYAHLVTMINNFPEDDPPMIYWLRAVHHQLKGETDKVQLDLQKIEEAYHSGSSGSPAWFMAMYYCHLEDYEKAFQWLQKSFDRHEVEMTWIKEEPLLAPVRTDPRYQEMFNKVGFPE